MSAESETNIADRRPVRLVVGEITMDLSTSINGTRLNIRAGGIISWDEKILVCKLPDQDWWFLPGGRVTTNESTEEALKRELSEEVGLDWELGNLRILSENFFSIDDEPFHEFCLYYSVLWKGVEFTSKMKESDETFRWVTRQEIEEINLLPAFLKEACFEEEVKIQHVITRDSQPIAGGDSAR